MIRLLAILGLLPLLAVVAAFGLVQRVPPSLPAAESAVAQSVDSAAVAPATPAQPLPPRAETPAEPQASAAPVDVSPAPSPADLEPIPTSPFPEFAIPASPPALPVAKPETTSPSHELLELEVALLRDTNRDLLAAVEALKSQLIQAQAEVAKLQAMLPLQEKPQSPAPQ